MDWPVVSGIPSSVVFVLWLLILVFFVVRLPRESNLFVASLFRLRLLLFADILRCNETKDFGIEDSASGGVISEHFAYVLVGG